MKNFVTIVLALLVGGFATYFFVGNRGKITRKEQSDIIVEQIKEVTKLITLESNFSEVYTLDQNQKLFEIIPIKKSAVVIARGKGYIAYNLEEMTYKVDEKSKTITLSTIPEPEIIIEPELEFYDFKANLIPFNREELSLLNERATELLREEAKKEEFLQLAEKNLEASLLKIFVVAEHYGWEVNVLDPE